MKAEYVDHMGTDLSVVNAAKVSFDNISEWDYVDCGHLDCGPECPGRFKVLKAKDKRLIQFLARGCTNDEWIDYIKWATDMTNPTDIENLMIKLKYMATHWTPFTHTAITFRMKAPVPIRTQCFKHKVGFTENEESRRYIKSTPELYIPEHFRSAPEGNIKQGSAGEHPDSDSFLIRYKNSCNAALALYEDMVRNGVCPEQARFVLPQGVYVNWIWTGNVASYARYFNQRTDDHAQKEHKALTDTIDYHMKRLFPVSWEALTRD